MGFSIDIIDKTGFRKVRGGQFGKETEWDQLRKIRRKVIYRSSAPLIFDMHFMPHSRNNKSA